MRKGKSTIGVLSPLSFDKGAMRATLPFHKSIIANLMVYQDGLETCLLQLFARDETSE